jgi:hypothetical protein
VNLLLRLGFPECTPRDFCMAFADDLRESAVVIHASPPKDGRPPNAGTSAGRVLDLCPDDAKAVLLKSRSESTAVICGKSVGSLKRAIGPAYRP